MIEHLRGSIRDLQKQLRDQQQQQQPQQQQQSSSDSFDAERKELTEKYERQTYELILATTAKATAEAAMEAEMKEKEQAMKEKEDVVKEREELKKLREEAEVKLKRVREECSKFVAELKEIKDQKLRLTEEWNQLQVKYDGRHFCC